MTESNSAGWLLAESLAMELDTALTILGGYYNPQGYSIPGSFAPLVESASDEWLDEWGQYFTPGVLVSLLSTLSLATDTFAETDYSKLTLQLREMNTPKLLEHLVQSAGVQTVEVDDSLSPEGTLIELFTNIEAQSYVQLGLSQKNESHIALIKRNMANIPRILQGGDLHARFWHWLDRMYYQSYEPWRHSRESQIKEQRKLGFAALGAVSGETPPEVSWLPAQNPVLRIPEINTAILAGQFKVFFWIEPFGLIDNWTFWPDHLLVTSFAEPGELYEHFRAYATDIAGRIKALSDPTRLSILRIIRHFGMSNTDIASFLGLARPTVSIHAKILQAAGLIRSSKDGRETKHEIMPEDVHRLFADLKTFLDLPEMVDANVKETPE